MKTDGGKIAFSREVRGLRGAAFRDVIDNCRRNFGRRDGACENRSLLRLIIRIVIGPLMLFALLMEGRTANPRRYALCFH